MPTVKAWNFLILKEISNFQSFELILEIIKSAIIFSLDFNSLNVALMIKIYFVLEN